MADDVKNKTLYSHYIVFNNVDDDSYSRTDTLRDHWTFNMEEAINRLEEDVRWCNGVSSSIVYPVSYGLVTKEASPIVCEGTVHTNDDGVAMIGECVVNNLVDNLFDEHEGLNVRVTVEFID